MIFIRLAGGLGNQLFQLAAALHVQSKTNKPICFFTNHLKNYSTPREFMLQEILPGDFQMQFLKPNKLIQLILKYRINKLLPLFFRWSITSKNIDNIKLYKFYVLDDYFQDVAMLTDELKIVANYIKSAAENNKKITDLYTYYFQQNTTVAIHIRRGDYLKKEYRKILVTQPDEYYRNALDTLQCNFESILLFSNDVIESFVEIAKTKFIFSNELSLTDIEEFLLMSKFENLIIANSTYSFWAALASKENNKITSNIIAPKAWYFNNKQNDIWLNNLKLCSIATI